MSPDSLTFAQTAKLTTRHDKPTIFGCFRGIEDIAMLAKRLAACTRLSTTVSQLFELQLQKIAIFMYPGLHFLFALGTLLWQSHKTLHEWKDNSVLTKPLAACAHLSTTVSQLFDPQVQKISRTAAIIAEFKHRLSEVDLSSVLQYNFSNSTGYT